MINFNSLRKFLIDLDSEFGPFDHCAICNTTTEYRRNVHIDQRNFYIEGVGQLCRQCYEDIYHGTSCGCCEEITPIDDDYKLGNLQLCKNCFIYAFCESIEEKHGHDDLNKFF